MFVTLVSNMYTLLRCDYLSNFNVIRLIQTSQFIKLLIN